MGIGVSIVDRLLPKRAARVDAREGEENALVVAPRPLKFQEQFGRPFFNPFYGIDLNVNGAYSGTPENVHDGTDNVYWTASVISGVKWTFNSVLQNHTPAGSKSVWSNSSAVGDTAQFATGSAVDFSNYIALTFWIYIDDNWAENDSVILYFWDTGTGSIVGSSVAIEDYVEWGTFDVWQKVAIPLSQFGITSESADALRIEISVRDVVTPSFFIDDVRIEEAGTPVEFVIAPDQGKWFTVERVRLIFVAAYDTSIPDGTVPGLSYDDFIGVNIDNGIIYSERTSTFPAGFNIAIRQMSDLWQLPSIAKFDVVCDGTNTMVALTFQSSKPGALLKPENNDRISIIIQDDLSGLLLARAFADGMSEER